MADATRIVTTYTAAADTFDRLPFWHHYGRRTVDLLDLRPGQRVLDLCCGTGGSAIPAAEKVGSSGQVVGVDLTPALVEQARAAAATRGFTQATFIAGDVAALDYPAASFDAVISVFGLFFLDDMPSTLARAWSWLSPGGALGITVWASVNISPGEDYFWEAVHRDHPVASHISPSQRLAPPGALAELFVSAGLDRPRVVTEPWRMPLATPDDFWPVVMGTSNRGVFAALSPGAQAAVKHEVIERLRRERVDGLDMAAHIAMARKPG
ncbi:MAG: methyltransferase domain-containing protein [Acidobacteriota bacterium]